MFVNSPMTIEMLLEQAHIIAEDAGLDLASATVEVSVPGHRLAYIPDTIEFDYDNEQIVLVLDPECGDFFEFSRLSELVEEGSGYTPAHFAASWRMQENFGDVFALDAVAGPGEPNPDLSVLRIF